MIWVPKMINFSLLIPKCAVPLYLYTNLCWATPPQVNLLPIMTSLASCGGIGRVQEARSHCALVLKQFQLLTSLLTFFCLFEGLQQ